MHMSALSGFVLLYSDCPVRELFNCCVPFATCVRIWTNNGVFDTNVHIVHHDRFACVWSKCVSYVEFHLCRVRGDSTLKLLFGWNVRIGVNISCAHVYVHLCSLSDFIRTYAHRPGNVLVCICLDGYVRKCTRSCSFGMLRRHLPIRGLNA